MERPFQPLSTTPQTMTPGVGGQTIPGAQGEWSPLQKLLGAIAIGKKQAGTAWNILKPQAPSAGELEKKEEKKLVEGVFNKLDSLLKQWEDIPLLARLPIPGISKISPERAKYETARNSLNYALITMVADKRITDQERKYWLRLFPSLVSTKEVARAKINELKDFLKVHTGIEPPATRGEMNIDDLIKQF